MSDHSRRPAQPGLLGATLYVPATHPDLSPILSGVKLPGVRSLIVCLEDAVRSIDVPVALERVAAALPGIGPDSPTVFVRPRSIEMVPRLLRLPGSERLAGLALPKASGADVEAAVAALRDHPDLVLMPILETAAVFDDGAMRDLVDLLADPSIRPRILLARIGGNDLLRCLGLRRDITRTIYESPIGQVIGRLVTLFLPRGIPLSSPVFDGLGDPAVLCEEVRLDLAHGLRTKTAAHPEQTRIIEQLYRPAAAEVEMATALLARDAPAVFRLHDRMCEVAVHRPWASEVLDRARWFGVGSDDPSASGGRESVTGAGAASSDRLSNSAQPQQ